MNPTFKEICHNDPAVAIEALIESLSHQERFPWVELDYSTYNEADMGICYACGATFTVLALLSSEPIVPPIDPDIFDCRPDLADELNLDYADLCAFESAMDSFRTGFVRDLGVYFDCSLPSPADQRWHLTNDRPLDDLPLIIDYYNDLIANRAAV